MNLGGITKSFVLKWRMAFYFYTIVPEGGIMELLEKYLNKIEFDNYDDFKQNLKINVPEDFDFARDIVDKWAEIEPDKLALLYCNDFNEEKI